MEPRSQKGNTQNWVICWQESSRKLCFCPVSPGYCRRTIIIPGGLQAEPIWGRVPWDIGRQWWVSLWNADLGGLRRRWHSGLWRFYSNAGHFSFKIISVSSRDCLKLLLLISVSYLCSEVKHHKVGVSMYVCMYVCVYVGELSKSHILSCDGCWDTGRVTWIAMHCPLLQLGSWNTD